MTRRLVGLIAILTLVTAGATTAAAKEKYKRRASRAAAVLRDVMSARDSQIPSWILDDAVGIIVIPSAKKAGLGIGGRYGRGLGTFRHPGGPWGPPIYYSLHGGSFGLQIGGQAVDVVLVIVNEDGVESLFGDKVTLGAGAGLTAGPVGRNAEADTNLRMRAKILSYARSRGLFAGLTLEGAVLKPDRGANTWAYGRGYTPSVLAYDGSIKPPAGVAVFTREVRRIAP